MRNLNNIQSTNRQTLGLGNGYPVLPNGRHKRSDLKTI